MVTAGIRRFVLKIGFKVSEYGEYYWFSQITV